MGNDGIHPFLWGERLLYQPYAGTTAFLTARFFEVFFLDAFLDAFFAAFFEAFFLEAFLETFFLEVFLETFFFEVFLETFFLDAFLDAFFAAMVFASCEPRRQHDSFTYTEVCCKAYIATYCDVSKKNVQWSLSKGQLHRTLTPHRLHTGHLRRITAGRRANFPANLTSVRPPVLKGRKSLTLSLSPRTIHQIFEGRPPRAAEG